jgi:predicted aldo/keto reductase-like oxidoreductase
MRKVRLGRTGLSVSQFGFGGIPIQRLAEDEAVAVVKRCLDLGVTFLDTANGYTTSEERIGKAISGRREGLVIATKSLSRKAEGVEKHLKLSLERLNVQYIDIYQFHGVSDDKTLETVLAPDGPMAVVEKAKEAGLVKHIGVTSHQIDVAKRAVISNRFETLMFPFNFVTSEAADELLPLCRRYDVGFIAMKPLAGGMIPNVRVAIKYLLQFPDVVICCGIEKASEVEEIVEIVEGPAEMTSAELDEMHRLKRELGSRFCHRCDYCQPCKEGIAISTVLMFPSLLRRGRPENIFNGPWAQAVEKAAGCTQCGECEQRCPYQLPIREMIAEHVSLFRRAKEEYLKQKLPSAG